MSEGGLELGTFCHENDSLTARPQLIRLRANIIRIISVLFIQSEININNFIQSEININNYVDYLSLLVVFIYIYTLGDFTWNKVS